MAEVNEKLEAQIKQDAEVIDRLLSMMGQRLVGQKHVAQRLVEAMIADGHVLLEGLPGLAKTTAVKTLSEATDLSVARIQFTPDLLPADVIGTQIYDPKNSEFKVKKGPVFTNLLIADEINRAPAKVQSALLEAMQEHQITIGDETFKLEAPFLVMATQNPIEQEGTYPLPEAQVDRFFFKVLVKYGTIAEEEEIISRMSSGQEIPIDKVAGKKEILQMRQTAAQIHVADKIRRYIAQIVFASREPDKYGLKDIKNLISYGASPRASINLERAARVVALTQGRAFVTPQDIKDVGPEILRHRIILTYEAEAENITTDEIIRRIFERIDVP